MHLSFKQIRLILFCDVFSANGVPANTKSTLSIKYVTACIQYVTRNFQKFLADNYFISSGFTFGHLICYTTQNFVDPKVTGNIGNFNGAIRFLLLNKIQQLTLNSLSLFPTT